MIIATVLLGLTVLLMGFSIYIVGVISSKIDMVVYYLKMICSANEHTDEENFQKQFMGMLNYTAEERRDADE